MRFLIDSNVLIDVSRGNRAAIDYVDRLIESSAISQVTALELTVGARDKRYDGERRRKVATPAEIDMLKN
jgi:predicted nucleic acid-binding protein